MIDVSDDRDCCYHLVLEAPKHDHIVLLLIDLLDEKRNRSLNKKHLVFDLWSFSGLLTSVLLSCLVSPPVCVNPPPPTRMKQKLVRNFAN